MDRASTARYAPHVTIIDWNGADVPEALRGLPAGRYALEPLSLAALTVEEEDGLIQALDSLRAGRSLPHDEARSRVLRRITP